MRIATVVGTRPEIIRLSRIIPKLDQHCEHVLIHTGQNHSPRLSDIFFAEMSLRAPDYHLGVNERDFARQIGQIMAGCYDIFTRDRPDRLLILGDTNSALAAFVAKRLGIPVFHMEAGNRCFDDRVPEEPNRRIVDHSSDVLLPYTERSRQNLLREGIRPDRIFVTGNPINEVMRAHREQIAQSKAFDTLQVQPGGYLLVTLHRAENVDISERLRNFLRAFQILGEKYGPVLVSTHPRTRARLQAEGIESSARVVFMEPLGFFDFVALEKSAKCVLSDSGTVQEECAIMQVPSVTLRDVTERPETLECGANLLSGADPQSILSAVEFVLSSKHDWNPPSEYLNPNVSDTVLRIVTGYVQGLRQPETRGGVA